MATRGGRGRGQGGRGRGVHLDNQQVSTTHYNQESMMSLLNSSNPSNSPMFSPPGSGGIIRAEFSQTDPAIAYHASNSVLQRTGANTYAPTRGSVVDRTSAFDTDSRRRQSPGSLNTSDDTANYAASTDAQEEEADNYHQEDEADEREQGRHERNHLFPTLHHTDRVRFNFINTYSH